MNISLNRGNERDLYEFKITTSRSHCCNSASAAEGIDFVNIALLGNVSDSLIFFADGERHRNPLNPYYILLVMLRYDVCVT